MSDDEPRRDLTRGAVWKGLAALAVLVGLLILVVTAIAAFLPNLAPGL